MCAWLLLRERIQKRTTLGMAVALAGVTLVAGSGVAEGRALGFALAMGAMLLIVVYNIALRANRDIEMLPSVAYSMVITACVAGTMLWASGAGFELAARELFIIQLMGAGSLGAGLVLFTLATRLRPVAELSLFAQLEIVLTPLWVWLGVGEVPGATVLAGGGLIVLALVIALAPVRR
jgi:drug/metabolite transporter (DMT)-like permease